MIRRPPRSTPKPSSAASDVYKRQDLAPIIECPALSGIWPKRMLQPMDTEPRDWGPALILHNDRDELPQFWSQRLNPYPRRHFFGRIPCGPEPFDWYCRPHQDASPPWPETFHLVEQEEPNTDPRESESDESGTDERAHPYGRQTPPLRDRNYEEEFYCENASEDIGAGPLSNIAFYSDL